MSAAASPDRRLEQELAGWPVGSAAVLVVTADGPVRGAGDVDREHPWASVTKMLTALTVLGAAEDGLLDLDEPAGPPGATVRHLLAHTAGLAFDSDKVMAAPGRRRIYSNRGTEVVADHLAARAGRPFAALLAERVLEPLGMTRTRLAGSPAHGALGPANDLALLAGELLAPRRLSRSVVAAAGTTAYPGLAGVLPGFGRQQPNDWGLGFEVRGTKAPHWTSPRNAPTTFGHFGQSGAFVWVDPTAGLACVATCDTPFGDWAVDRWPALADLVLDLHHDETRSTA